MTDPFKFELIDMPKESPASLKKKFPGLTYEQYADTARHLNRCHHFRSSLYHVALDCETEHGFGELPEGGYIAHLSIKRHDREPMQDWRVMQKIKSAIVGPETEAIELYPAESRVVDTANQYHLYAFMNCGMIPVGFPKGARTDESKSGAVQRPGAMA